MPKTATVLSDDTVRNFARDNGLDWERVSLGGSERKTVIHLTTLPLVRALGPGYDLAAEVAKKCEVGLKLKSCATCFDDNHVPAPVFFIPVENEIGLVQAAKLLKSAADILEQASKRLTMGVVDRFFVKQR